MRDYINSKKILPNRFLIRVLNHSPLINSLPYNRFTKSTFQLIGFLVSAALIFCLTQIFTNTKVKQDYLKTISRQQTGNLIHIIISMWSAANKPFDLSYYSHTK